MWTHHSFVFLTSSILRNSSEYFAFSHSWVTRQKKHQIHDLLKPHVTGLVVCDPRKNVLLKDGSKSDRIDARKLAELLRGNQLTSVYHGEHGMRTLKELGRSYVTITKDLPKLNAKNGEKTKEREDRNIS